MEPIYHCLIVDDEKPAHLVLRAHIDRCPNLVWCQSTYNGEEALQYLAQNPVEVVFLDVQMPLVTGIELLAMLPTPPAVVMTTAYTEFAFSAYQYDAVDYLQKPITYQRFLQAIEKIKKYSRNHLNLSKPPAELTFRVNGEVVVIQSSDIMYAEAWGNYIKIYLTGQQQRLVVYESLATLLTKLDPAKFVQVHRSYLINREYLTQVTPNWLLLKGGQQVPVGRKFQILLT